MAPLIFTTIEQGLIFAVLAIGVFLTYKILDIPDLSVEGTFPLGAFVFANLALKGVNPFAALIVVVLSGMIAGFVTAILFIKLKIKPLLAGILTSTMLYSINLKINAKSNVSISKAKRLYDLVIFPDNNLNKIFIMIIIVIFIKIIIDIFMKTEMGYLLKTTGDNEILVKSLGQSSDKYKIIGLMCSNGLVALSGAIMASSQSFADISMGQGIIVIALASIIIGDTFLRNNSIIKGTTRAIIGAVIYKIIGAIALEMGMNAQDLKLVNAVIVILFIAYNNESSKFLARRRSR